MKLMEEMVSPCSLFSLPGWGVQMERTLSKNILTMRYKTSAILAYLGRLSNDLLQRLLEKGAASHLFGNAGPRDTV